MRLPKKYKTSTHNCVGPEVLNPCAICVAQDPRNYKSRVSLRAFRRTRVICYVLSLVHRSEKLFLVAKYVYTLDQALFCEWDVVTREMAE